MKFFLLCAALIASGCVIHAEASPPVLNILPRPILPGAAMVRLENIPSGPQAQLCSETSGVKDLCITNLLPSVQRGFDALLPGFFQPGSPNRLEARFRVVQFSHSVTSVTKDAATVELRMKWQFEVRAPDGTPLIQLAEETVGPERLANVFASDKAVTALLSAVFDRIGAGLMSMPTPQPVSTAVAAQPVTSPVAAPALAETPAAAPAPIAAGAVAAPAAP
jgi:hypothetical protein